MAAAFSEKFVRNANFRLRSELTGSENLRVSEAQQFGFNKPPVILIHIKVGNHWYGAQTEDKYSAVI